MFGLELVRFLFEGNLFFFAHLLPFFSQDGGYFRVVQTGVGQRHFRSSPFAPDHEGIHGPWDVVFRVFPTLLLVACKG